MARIAKPRRAKKPDQAKQDEELKDYSHLYSNFYDIFVGQQVNSKEFDLNYAVRESRNIYASFVNLMESNHIAMQ